MSKHPFLLERFGLCGFVWLETRYTVGVAKVHNGLVLVAPTLRKQILTSQEEKLRRHTLGYGAILPQLLGQHNVVVFGGPRRLPT